MEELGIHNQIGDCEVDLSEYVHEIFQALEYVPNEEGYVVTYLRRDQDRLKVKIKMADYVRLHRIVTGMNAHTVWEILKEGNKFQTKDLPEHIIRWYLSWTMKLMGEHAIIRLTGDRLFADRPILVAHETERQNRARRAAWFFEQGKPELKSLFFAMLDGRNIEEIDEIVWDMIEPRGDDRSFQPLNTEEASA